MECKEQLSNRRRGKSFKRIFVTQISASGVSERTLENTADRPDGSRIFHEIGCFEGRIFVTRLSASGGSHNWFPDRIIEGDWGPKSVSSRWRSEFVRKMN